MPQGTESGASQAQPPATRNREVISRLVLNWDGLDDGNWGDIDASTGISRWLDEEGAHSVFFPGVPTLARVNTSTVTVAEDAEAGGLDVESGAVVVADNTLLYVGTFVYFAEGAALELGAGAQLGVGLEGAMLDSVSTGDGASIHGNVIVAGTVSPGNRAGRLTIDGNFEMTDSALYVAELDGPDNDIGAAFGNFNQKAAAAKTGDDPQIADLLYYPDSGKVKLDPADAAGDVIINF